MKENATGFLLLGLLFAVAGVLTLVHRRRVGPWLRIGGPQRRRPTDSDEPISELLLAVVAGLVLLITSLVLLSSAAYYAQ